MSSPSASPRTPDADRSSNNSIAQADAKRDEPGLLAGIWNSGLWRLFPFLLLFAIGIAIVIPIMPGIFTNGFASAAAGEPIDCQQYSVDDAPTVCRDAHATAVQWGSWTNFISSSVLSFLCAPWVGRLSDRYGRKPFMLIGSAFSLLPLLVLVAHLWGWVGIYWYYPANVLQGMVSAFSMILMSVADMVEQRHRATSVGLLTSMLSIGIGIGPVIGGLLPTPLIAIYACVGCCVATFLYVLFMVPEMAPRKVKAVQLKTKNAAAAAETAAEEGRGPAAAEDKHKSAFVAPPPLAQSGYQIIMGSKFYRRLTVLWIVFTVNFEGAQVLLLQYLQLTLGFTARDNAMILVVMATAGLIVKVGCLAWLVRHLGERYVFMLGIVAYCFEDLAFALAPSRAYVLGAVAVGAVSGVCWPALVALQSSRVAPEQQGAVYGATQGITSLASGLGPIGFAWLFSAFTRSDSGLPFFPAIVWYVSVGMMSIGLVVAATLFVGVESTQEEDTAAAARARNVGAAVPNIGPLVSVRSFARTMSRLTRLDSLRAPRGRCRRDVGGTGGTPGSGGGSAGGTPRGCGGSTGEGGGDMEQPLLGDDHGRDVGWGGGERDDGLDDGRDGGEGRQELDARVHLAVGCRVLSIIEEKEREGVLSCSDASRSGGLSGTLDMRGSGSATAAAAAVVPPAIAGVPPPWVPPAAEDVPTAATAGVPPPEE